MPKRTSSGRFETCAAGEAEELSPAQMCDQNPNVVETAELEDPLDHPDRVFCQVRCLEAGVPEQTTELLDHLGAARSTVLGFPGFESDDELAAQRSGQLLQSGDLKTGPPVFVPRQSRSGGVGSSSELGQRKAELLSSVPKLTRDCEGRSHGIIIHDNISDVYDFE